MQKRVKCSNCMTNDPNFNAAMPQQAGEDACNVLLTQTVAC
jgi:hypothetical protein